MGLHIRLDVDEAERILVRFIRDYVTGAGRAGVVLGLSGGLDSAVVLTLAARALGPDKVHAFWLPSRASRTSDHDDAAAVARSVGVPLHVRDIQPIVDGVTATLGTDKREVVANAMARARMIVLYGEAAARDAIVLGTGNKSELLTGYFTKHGDGGADLLPIGDLYKTQVRELAAHLGVPSRLIEKPPTAGLWAGQTDEADLGITYDQLDRVLLGLEIDLPHDRIAADAGVDTAEVARIGRLRAATQHKRTTPLICKLGIRSPGTDWRDPVLGAAPKG